MQELQGLARVYAEQLAEARREALVIVIDGILGKVSTKRPLVDAVQGVALEIEQRMLASHDRIERLHVPRVVRAFL